MSAGISICAEQRRRVEAKSCQLHQRQRLWGRAAAIKLKICLPREASLKTFNFAALEKSRVTDSQRPNLERLYHRYLESEDTAAFVINVSERYLLSTLARLAIGGNHVSRRAAVMAVGFLGDYSHNAVLG